MLRLGLNDCCLSQRKANLSIADYRQEILDYMIFETFCFTYQITCRLFILCGGVIDTIWQDIQRKLQAFL